MSVTKVLKEAGNILHIIEWKKVTSPLTGCEFRYNADYEQTFHKGI